MKHSFKRLFYQRFLVVVFIAIPLTSVFSQDSPALQEKVGNMASYAQIKAEKLYVHLSKQELMPGETVWYRVYLTEAADLGRAGINDIVYFQLFNKAGESKAAWKIAEGPDGFSGSYSLGEDIDPGIYTLTAYTHTLRRFGADHFFKIPLAVGGTFDELSATKGLKVGVEGGKLIAGANQKVMLAAGADSLQATLYDSKGTALAKIIAPPGETGFVNLRPEAGEIYRMTWQTNHGEGTYNLPSPVNSGATISLLGLNDEGANFLVQTAGNFLINQPAVYLAIIGHGELLEIYKISHSGRKAFTYQVPASVLSPGLQQAILFNDAGETISSRLFFVPLAREMPKVAIETSKSRFATREAVDLNVLVKDKLGNPLPGAYSVSVTNAPVKPGYEISRSLYLFDLNEAKVNIPLSSSSPSMVNDYLVTISESEFNWNTMVKKPFDASYLAPEKNLRIRGRLVNEKGEPYIGVVKMIIYFSRENKIYQFYTEQDGSFERILNDEFTGEKEYWYTLEGVVGNVSLKPDHGFIEYLENPLEKKMKPFAQPVLDKWKINKIYAAFAPQTISENSKEAEKQKRIAPDYTVIPAEYKSMPTLEEVIYELLPPLAVRKREGERVFKVFARHLNKDYDEPAQVFIDGTPTRDYEGLLAIPMRDIKEISVYQTPSKLGYFGNLLNSGMVMITTEKPDFYSRKFTDQTLKSSVLGYYATNPYEPVNYDTTNAGVSPLPDFRQVLYWNPSLYAGESFRFFTSDDTGTFYINVQGITEDGIPFSGSVPFSVSYLNE